MTLENLELEASVCTSCDLYTGRLNPVFAKGYSSSDIIICGTVPSKDDNNKGKPFIDIDGIFLDTMLQKANLYDKVYITNLVKCFVDPSETLKSSWINTCKHFFDNQIKMIRPKVIISLGLEVSLSLINSGTSDFENLRGQIFKQNKIYIIPTYHPSYLQEFCGEGSVEYSNSISDFNMAKVLAHGS